MDFSRLPPCRPRPSSSTAPRSWPRWTARAGLGWALPTGHRSPFGDDRRGCKQTQMRKLWAWLLFATDLWDWLLSPQVSGLLRIVADYPTLWGVHAVAMFSFLFLSFLLEFPFTNRAAQYAVVALSAWWLVEHVKNNLQNITTEWMPQSVNWRNRILESKH